MEVSTAVNFMYRLYQRTNVYLAYLSDFPNAGIRTLVQSDWFNRGWTLQELLAPLTGLFRQVLENPRRETGYDTGIVR